MISHFRPAPRRSPYAPWWITVAIAGCTGGGGATPTSTTDASSSSSSSSSSEGSTGAATSVADSSAGDADESSTSSAGPPLYFDVGQVADMGVPPKGGAVCSSDLKYVVDGDSGAIIEACPNDQGCLAGECVGACVAAAGSDGSTGCEFTIPTSPFYANGMAGASQAGPCHALLVSNPWGRPAQLELSRGGEDYDIEVVTRVPSGIGATTVYDDLPNSGVPNGSVAVVFLSHRPGVNNGTTLECPIGPAVLDDTAAFGTDAGVAFELTSDTPIQVYDIIPYGGASTFLPSASLIFPNTAWGDSYLVAAPHAQTGAEWMLAVARDDDTTITIRPTAAITPGTISTPPVAVATDYTIDAGEVLQWQSVGDPVGSIINADRPIGVFSGNTYLRVTTADDPVSGQDAAHQMIPDVNALGTEYVGGGLFSRLAAFAPESVLYRIVGVVDNTDLSWDSDPPIGAPTSLEAGEVYEFETRDFFSVRSQSDDFPFSLSQYMSGTLSGQPGCGSSPGVCQLGDDEWVMLVPPQQFLRYYAFFVDPTYGTSTLVLVRVRGATGFADVDVECMGNVEDWMPVGDSGEYEVAHVELFRSSMGMHPECETSQHVASSDGDFGVVVWGTDSAASYGYPAGGGLESINGVILDPAG
jgi:IgGFc binding protein